MAQNYKDLGHRVKKVATGTIVSGKPCVQGTLFGIAMTSVLVGETFMLGIHGVWNIAVPASTAEGDLLFVPGANGALTTSVDVTVALTRTGSNANSPVCRAIEARRADGTADVIILPPGATVAATQV